MMPERCFISGFLALGREPNRSILGYEDVSVSLERLIAMLTAGAETESQ